MVLFVLIRVIRCEAFLTTFSHLLNDITIFSDQRVVPDSFSLQYAANVGILADIQGMYDICRIDSQ